MPSRGEVFPAFEVGRADILPLLAGAVSVAAVIGQHRVADCRLALVSDRGALADPYNYVRVTVPNMQESIASFGLATEGWGNMVRGGVRLRTEGRDMLVAATPATALGLLGVVAGAAPAIQERPAWRVQVDGFGGGSVVQVPFECFVPVALDLAATFASGLLAPQPDTRTTVRIGLLCNTAAQLYRMSGVREGSGIGEGTLEYKSHNERTQTEVEFNMVFRPRAGRQDKEEYCAMQCTLRRSDRSGDRPITLNDFILQYGNRMIGAQTIRSGGSKPELGRTYLATGDTLLRMARAAVACRFPRGYT
jgi:hypothetical protein